MLLQNAATKPPTRLATLLVIISPVKKYNDQANGIFASHV